VDVPADDIDLPGREQQSLPQSTEILGGIVQDGQPSRLASLPDGIAGNEDG
jgi:hypothetical protein